MKQDGGPAFPDKVVQNTVLGPSVFARMDGGMTLRDWFAGQALAGICSGSTWSELNSGTHEIANVAFLLADHMLTEREKP